RGARCAFRRNAKRGWQGRRGGVESRAFSARRPTMKLHLDLSMVEARPGRWAAWLGGGVGAGGASKAAELARVMGYLAREFSTVRRTVMWRRETKEPGGRARYALRPFASIRTPGPLDGRWLALVCEYNEATRALVVVDREAVDS